MCVAITIAGITGSGAIVCAACDICNTTASLVAVVAAAAVAVLASTGTATAVGIGVRPPAGERCGRGAAMWGTRGQVDSGGYHTGGEV